MNKQRSLSRYLALQMLLLVSSFVLIYSLTIDEVYQWGIDDNSHYFISLEADRAYQSLRLTGQLPKSPDHYTYYSSVKELPSALQTEFAHRLQNIGELLLSENDQRVIYLMPVQYPEGTQLFYVRHDYVISDDDYDVGLSIPQLLLALGSISLLLVVLWSLYLVWSIIKPVRLLEKWAEQVGVRSSADVKLEVMPELRFKELSLVAKRLQSSLADIEHANRREKGFLRSLSHELRTPLAISKAALELLEKPSNELSAAVQKKLERMRRANNNMLAITECLLWLWRGKEYSLAMEPTYLQAVVEAAVSSNEYLLKNKAVTICVELEAELRVMAEKRLLAMLINNLLRNAFQYTQQGFIKVTGKAGQLTISNTLSAESAKSAAEPCDYGYGVGLYLVEKLCQQKGWSLTVQRQAELFVVTVDNLTAESKD